MKKILVLIGLVVCGIAYGQENRQTFYVGGGGSSSIDESAVGAQIADSLENLTLGVDVATSADSVLVLDDGKLKVMSKAEFLADIYSALNQIAGLDIVAPVLDSIELGRYNDSILVAFFDTTDLHQDSVPPLTAFSITENGTVMGLDSVYIHSDSLLVQMDSVGLYGATYLFSYTKDDPALQDSSGNEIGNVSGHAVVNNVSEPEAPSSNMISNGTFDSEIGWTVSQFVISGGVASTPTSSTSLLGQSAASMNIAISATTTYTVTFDLTVLGVGTETNISIANSDGTISYTTTATYSEGTFEKTFTTPVDIGGGGIRFRALNALGYGCTIDNIVMVETVE